MKVKLKLKIYVDESEIEIEIEFEIEIDYPYYIIKNDMVPILIEASMEFWGFYLRTSLNLIYISNIDRK